MENIINIIIGLILSGFILGVGPSVFSEMLDEKDQKEQSNIQFLLFGKFTLFVFILPTILFFIHGFIYNIIAFLLKIFKIKIHQFGDSDIAGNFGILYFFLLLVISAVVANLHINKEKIG